MSVKFRTAAQSPGISAQSAGITAGQAQRTDPPPPPPTVRKEFPETWIWQHSETGSECVIIWFFCYLGNHFI